MNKKKQHMCVICRTLFFEVKPGEDLFCSEECFELAQD